jgi:hypothetical protein
MAALGIQGICGRRKVATTRRDPTAAPAVDLVARHFDATELDRLYVGDITSIPTAEGFCYLAGVLDVCEADGGMVDRCPPANRALRRRSGRPPSPGGKMPSPG